MVTHCWTRCLCACPAVGDSNNSYCVPVKAERLCESIHGILGITRFYWLRSCCSSRLCVTRTTPDRGGDARSPSIIVYARRLFRFRQLHQSHRCGMKLAVAWNSQGCCYVANRSPSRGAKLPSTNPTVNAQFPCILSVESKTFPESQKIQTIS